MSTSSSTSNRRQHGAAMVEMAILISLLVMLFLGITELGRAVYFQQKLSKATEAATRHMGRSWEAVNPADCTEGAQWGAATVLAANLAVFGSSDGVGTAAVPGFDAGDLTFEVLSRDVTGVGTVCVVRVTASVAYEGIFGNDLIPVLGIAQPTLNAGSEERYVGD